MAKHKKKFIVAASFGVLVTLSLVFVLNSNQILRAIGVSKPAPVFTFNESKAPGWWATENYNSQASSMEDDQGSEPIDTLPVASMNLFKGKKGDNATACFVMFSYYNYKAHVTQLKKDKDSESLASTSMKKIGEDSLLINALGKDSSFVLTKYELIGPDSENSMKGMSYGWLGLGDGYLSVSGVCPTGVELDDTFTAISAIKLMLY